MAWNLIVAVVLADRNFTGCATGLVPKAGTGGMPKMIGLDEARMNKRQLYQAGMSAYHVGRYSEAIEHLRMLAVSDQGATALLSRFYLGQAHYRLAVSLFQRKRFQEATIHFQAAAQANPVGGGFPRFLAACHVGTGRFDLAARELETLLAHDPDDGDVRIRLALTQHKQGNPVEAITILRTGIRRNAKDAELHYQLGVMQATDGELADAEQQFENAITRDPSHARAHERLAQCCSLSGRHERALRHLEKSHQLDPSDMRVALQLNLLAQSLSATDANPSVGWRLSTRTRVSNRLDDVAVDQLGEMILKEPDFVEAFLSLPVSEVDEEIFSGLAATLKQALAKHPEYADLHHHCGEVYRRLGRNQDALAHAERAVEINPRYVQALMLVAELYGQTDHWRDGVKRLEQAVQAGGDYPDVHYLIGKLYENGQHVDRARKAYRRALDLNGDYQAAREALAMLPA